MADKDGLKIAWIKMMAIVSKNECHWTSIVTNRLTSRSLKNAIVIYAASVPITAPHIPSGGIKRKFTTMLTAAAVAVESMLLTDFLIALYIEPKYPAIPANTALTNNSGT